MLAFARGSWGRYIELMGISDHHLSPADAAALEARIVALAVECGIMLNDGHVGFGPDPLPNVAQVAEERGYAEAIWPWRRLLAECVNYLTIQGLTFEMMIRRGEGEPASITKASWSLSTKAASDARCVLHLCDHGFVDQAGIVARSCIEAIEALAAFCVDPSSADGFVSAQTLDESNRAWYLIIRNKARRAIDETIGRVSQIDQQTEEWRYQTQRMLGALVHPSYMTPFVTAYLDWERDKEGHPTLPARTLECIHTIQAIAAACFEHASVILLVLLGQRETPWESRELTPQPYENAGFFDEDWLDSYAARGHKFFQRLWILYLHHQDDPPFRLWRDARELEEPDE